MKGFLQISFIRGGKNPNLHVWKKCLPPLLKPSCGLSHLNSIAQTTPRPDDYHTCSRWRNGLNRTCLTKVRRPEDPQKIDVMLRSKEIQEQMRKRVIEIHQSGKGYEAICFREPLSTNGENMKQQWAFPKWLADQNYSQGHSDQSSKRSQKTQQQHPKNCRPHLAQFRSASMSPS